MAVKLKIKQGDRVVVLTGKDKGKQGEVERVLKGDRPGDHRVVVAGVNRVKRHTKPSQTTQGGIIEREAPIHVSNVMLADPASGDRTRIGHHVLSDGKRQRIAKKSGEAAPENEA